MAKTFCTGNKDRCRLRPRCIERGQSAPDGGLYSV